MLTVRRFNERMLPPEAGEDRVLHRVHRAGGMPDRECVYLSQADWVYGGYRDPGICLVRGVPLKLLVDQLMGNSPTRTTAGRWGSTGASRSGT